MRAFGDRVPCWPALAGVAALAGAALIAAFAPLLAALPALAAGGERTTPPVVLLGVALCALYLATGSLLPGITLAARPRAAAPHGAAVARLAHRA